MDTSSVDLALMQGLPPAETPQAPLSAEVAGEETDQTKALALLEALKAKPEKPKKGGKSKTHDGEVLDADIIATAAHQIENLTSKGALLYQTH